MNTISLEQLLEWNKKFTENENNKMIQNAVSGNNLENISLNRDILKSVNYNYSHRVTPIIKPTDQKSSGRCWIFSLMNSIRNSFIEKYNLETNFEFSQSYIFFYDKLERCNFYLNNIIS